MGGEDLHPGASTTEIVAWVRERFGHEVTQNQA
jgi:hypothetical protein